MRHEPSDQRLLELMAALMRREYVNGTERFPGEVTREDAKAIAADVHAAIDLAAEKRAEVAVAQGSRIACHAGCNKCCEQLVNVYAGEAELIADWLDEPEQAEARRAFVEAYPAWEEATREAIATVMERTRAGDAKGQFAALVAHWRRRILCAFNREGLCTIYPVRPAVCRHAHALDTNEHCHPAEATGTAAVSLHYLPLDEFLKKTRALSMAVHHARGGERRTAEPLPTAVFVRLAKR